MRWVLVPVANVKVSYLVAAVLLVGAFTHWLMAFGARSYYEAQLKNRVNLIRWLGLGSATALAVASLALLSGITDTVTLVLIFALIAITFFLSYTTEIASRHMQPVSWFSYAISVLTAVLAWLVVIFNAINRAVYGVTPLPTYLYFAYATTILVMTAMLTLQCMSIKRRDQKPFNDYLFVDRNYFFGSFARHMLFAAIVYFGFLH